MTRDPSRTRRDLLRATGAAGGVALLGSLAGCSGSGGGDGDSGDGGEDTTADTTATTTTTTTTATTTESGGGGGGGSDASGTVVDMNDQLQFQPTSISVSVGDTVTWENVGEVGHTVTAYEDSVPDGGSYFASGGFDGENAAREGFPDGSVGGGGTYEYTFEAAGTYEYFCVPHESAGMTGTVEVTE